MLLPFFINHSEDKFQDIPENLSFFSQFVLFYYLLDCANARQLLAAVDREHEAGRRRLEALLADRPNGQLPGLPEEDAGPA